ncbi:DUF1905 domain-containing protein [Flammeovirga sp. MY04]|uniref:DUF1905 domain-containing protein n=1 Tax=Flammeovirga sp. MY04 TaxID=1191459 RepID=UPI000806403F|nr:DUF1905 domain-containing protein [Flammeovirga sp. MY04]
MTYSTEQIISQLDKRKGGYFYLKLDADIINQFEQKKKTHLFCTLDNNLTFRCGLNHLGDGHFYIILSKKNLELIHKKLGDTVLLHIKEYPDPLGVDVNEVLEILLEQDEVIKQKFNQLTLVKRRSIIYQINRIKNIDKQIERCSRLILSS